MNLGESKVGLSLCVAGNAKALINGELYELQRGTLHIISPIIQAFIMQQSDDFAQCTILAHLEDMFPAVQSMYTTMLENKAYQHPCTQIDEQQIAMVLATDKRIAEKQADYTLTDSEEVRTLIRQIIISLQRTLMLETLQIFFCQRTIVPARATKTEHTAFEFLKLLYANYQTERSVAFYAAQSGLTPNHFTHTVKQVTGRTPMEWITTFTILEAKRLLSENGTTVKSVANLLHFPEQYTFARYFKTYTGTTPHAYKQSLLPQKAKAPSPLSNATGQSANS